MKRQYSIIALMLICTLLLSGCWDQLIFDQTALAIVSAAEESPDGKLLITYTYPVVDGKEKMAIGFRSMEVTLFRDAREHVRLSSPKMLEAGKIQEALISDTLAKTGIHDLLEVYQRDASNPAIAYIVVVEGSPKELLSRAAEFKAAPRVGFYLYQLLENNVKIGNIPNTKIFDFDINFFAEGMDPITPIIKIETDSIVVKGSALFSKDKMVGEIDEEATKILLGIMGQGRPTEFIYKEPKLPSDNKSKYGLSVILHKPKRKVNINFDESGKPVIKVSLQYNCLLDEYQWNKTDNETELGKLEKLLNGYLSKVANETIKYMQSVDSDPVGFGNMIRAKYYDYWKSIKWDEVYKDAEITVDIKAKIVRQGIIK